MIWSTVVICVLVSSGLSHQLSYHFIPQATIRTLFKRSSSNTSNEESSYLHAKFNEKFVIYDNQLIEYDGLWYIRNGYKADLIIKQGDVSSKVVAKYMYGQGKSRKWYRFFTPPSEFINYFNNLVPVCYDKIKTYFDGKNWFILSHRGTLEKIVKKHWLPSNDGMRVLCEDGQWHFIRNSSKHTRLIKDVHQLPSTDMKLVHAFVNQSDDRYLVKKDGVWYAQNETLYLDKLTMLGDGRGKRKVLYVRGKSGKWYKFTKPPKAFKQFVETNLPIYYDLTRISYSNGSWYLQGKLNNYYQKIISMGSIYDNKTLFVITDNKKWHRIRHSPQNSFVIDKLLRCLPKVQDRFDNFRLRLSDNNTLWYIIKEGRVRQFTHLGDYIIYTRCARKNWYRFKNPPIEFIQRLIRLQTGLNIAPFYETLIESKY